jgi:thiol:disulfide interchange protein DsbA
MVGTLLLLCSKLALAQGGQFQEGVHYFEIEQATAPRDYVEVTEVFSYLCNHCATFEPYVQAWKNRMPENVVLKRIPVVFGRRTYELYARGYVTASLMGIEEESHVAMMDSIWKERQQMRSMDDLAEFYSQFGVTKDAFLATAQSFSVDTQIRREQKMVSSYGVNATPTMVVNGRYRVPNGSSVLDVVDYLVARELAALEESRGAETAAAGDSTAVSN